MKFVSLILFILATIDVQSQNEIVDELKFQIYCGVGAQTSKDVQVFKRIVDINDTVTIRNKLFSNCKLEQVLATITVKHYQANGSLQLTEEQRKKVNQISKLKDKFSLCFTCTFQQDGTVKELFNRKNYLSSYSIIESYLLEKL